MGTRGERTLTQLEWFSVTYRAVTIYTVLGVLALIAAGSGWYYYRYHAPKSAARVAITEAEDLFKQAQPLADAEAHRPNLERAGDALNEAQDSFSRGKYQDALAAALHSTHLSRQALEVARGAQDTGRQLVRFYRLEGEVRVKHAGEFSWENANLKTVLNIGDQVKTSSSASAQLIYFDGTVTKIQPGSLLEIRDLYEDPVTKVRRVKQKVNFGEVEASTPKRNVRGSYHELSTEKVAARTEDAGEFRVAFDKEKQTSTVDAYTGQVEVTGGGRTESVAAGERLTAQADGKLGAKQGLPGVPRLLAPADERVFIFENPREHKISLSWEPVAGTSQYRLAISHGPLFSEAKTYVRDAPTAVVEAGPGTYYWRVASLKGGTAGQFSEPRAFRVSSQRIKDRDDTEPPRLDIQEFQTIGMMVIINGASEPGATLWVDNEKIEVYDDGRFYAVVRLRKEGENKLLFRAQDTAGNETRTTRTAYVEFY